MNSSELNNLASIKKVLDDNNFIIFAFKNRLLIRIVNILEKHKITFNKKIIEKNIEEKFISSFIENNNLLLDGYSKIITQYETIVRSHLTKSSDINQIKKSTKQFLEKIRETNRKIIGFDLINNFKEYLISVIGLYDNEKLNRDIINRLEDDSIEIINEVRKSNYNLFVELLNDSIKRIIEELS